MTHDRLHPYAAYKDSGIVWLRNIPAHWVVTRLKSFATVQPSNVDKKSKEGEENVRLCNYVDVYYNEMIDKRIDFMSATATSEQVRRFSLQSGDVLITKDSETWTDIAVPAVVSEDLPGVLCGYHLAHIRPGQHCNGGFLSRLFAAIGPRDQYHISANGITRFGLTGDSIRVGVFALPPVPEQRAIADFLDRETARIDALVAKKERLIELLREKRAALISHAVTKGLPADASVQAGLDPTVPMKDSGVEWLGEVPAHWEVKRLRSAIKFQRGHDLPSDDREEGDVPVVSSSGISAMHSKAVATAPGIVTGRCGTIGQFYLINQSYWPHNTALYSIDLHGNKPRFLRYMLIHMSPLFCLHSIKSAVPAVDRNDIHADYTTVPPLPEQRAIADFLDRETAKIDTLVANVRQVNERLKELRSALISAAVTGKIDVRDAPARAPDESGNSTADGSVMPGASGGMG